MIIYDIDEVFFLVDCFVMMINGFYVNIGEIMIIFFFCFWDWDRIMEDFIYYQLCNYVFDFFYNCFVYDDVVQKVIVKILFLNCLG